MQVGGGRVVQARGGGRETSAPIHRALWRAAVVACCRALRRVLGWPWWSARGGSWCHPVA